MADKVYYTPIDCKSIEEVIEKENPDAVTLSFGGQTALNCGIQLYNDGVFKKHGVEVLGTTIESVVATEDREIL